jgi:hypothetical protein
MFLSDTARSHEVTLPIVLTSLNKFANCFIRHAIADEFVRDDVAAPNCKTCWGADVE